ncbi:glycosyltransferase [Mariniflexile sp.]|uniref:glycosyltransferase n=1 Tax=Mariniflexile sp. TaxID=1979402 RepID=UPI00404862CC
MRVLQLIDSLEGGGAERVAVNFANALSKNIEASFLCATRAEGILKKSIDSHVGYVCLKKTKVIDFKAIKQLNYFVSQNKIELIHAHSTSFFLATVIKILNRKVTLVWHDHYGKSEFLEERPKFVLKCCSKFFDHVFCVNSKLTDWSKNTLKLKSVSFLPNFAVQNIEEPVTQLKGIVGKRIVCLANLRVQKDHFNLLNAFKLIRKEHSDWTLHLIGAYIDDDYYKSIKIFITKNKLEQHIFIYGSCSDTNHILNQSTIGVLSSKSEGLPLSLLEYGLAKLPVIATRVGDCEKVISNSEEGILVEPQNNKVLAEALVTYMNDLDLRHQVAQNLYEKVRVSFSESSAMESLISIYKTQQK